MFVVVIQQVEFDMWESYNDQYVRAFEGFNGNPVVASFYGHHHWATFRIVTDENVSSVLNNNSHVGFVSSSLTPDSNENPIFTEYTFQTKAPYTIVDRSYEFISLLNLLLLLLLLLLFMICFLLKQIFRKLTVWVISSGPQQRVTEISSAAELWTRSL